MDTEKWHSVLIEWVNCLKLCKNINSIEELRNGEFFSNLQKVISKSRNVQVDVLTFIFDLFSKHYPNYFIQNKTEIHLSDLSLRDLKAMTALLMHYTCIYDRKDVLTSPLCHSLSQTTQLLIRNFLQKITKDVTSGTINEIVRNCIDEANESTKEQWLCVETSTARNSPLQDLFKTPISKFGRLQEKDRMISKLKSELEVERFEKVELQEELKLQSERIKKVEKQLSQKNTEITRLRSEIVALENRTPPHYQDMDSRELQRRLRAEIQTLEHCIKQTEEEAEEIRKEKDVTKEQLRKMEERSIMWEEKFFEAEQNFESMSEHYRQQEEKLKELQVHCSELTAMLEEYRSKPGNNSSLDDTFTMSGVTKLNESNDAPPCEDLACSVVEVQLRDAQKQIEEFKIMTRLAEDKEVEMRESLEMVKRKLKKSEDLNEELEGQLLYSKEKLDDLSKKNEDLHSQNESLEKNLTKTCDWLQESKNQVEHLQNSHTILEKALDDLHATFGSLKKEHEIEVTQKKSLETVLTDANIRLQISEGKGSNYEKKNKDLLASVNCLQIEVSQIQEDLKLKNEYVENLMKIKGALENQLKKEQSLSNVLKIDLNKTIQALDAARRTIKKMEEEKLVIDSNLEKLQREYTDLEVRRTSEITDLHLQLNEVINKLNTSKIECEEIKNLKTKLEIQLEESQGVCSNLKSQLEVLQFDYSKLSDKTTILSEEVKEFEIDNKNLLSQNEKTSSQLIETSNELEMAKVRIQELKNRETTLETLLKDSNISIEGLKDEIQTIKTQHRFESETMKTEKFLLESEIIELKRIQADLEYKLGSVNEALKKKKSSVEKLEKENHFISDDLGRTKTQLTELEREKNEWRVKLQNLQTTNEELVILSGTLKEDLFKEKEIVQNEKCAQEDLQKNIAELNAALEQALIEKEIISSNLISANDQLGVLKSNIRVFEALQLTFEKTMLAVKHELTMMNKEVSFLKKEKHELETCIEMSKSEFDTISSEKEKLYVETRKERRLCQEKEELTSKVENLETINQDLLLQKSILEKEIVDYKLTYDEIDTEHQKHREYIVEIGKRKEELRAEIQATLITLTELRKNIKVIKTENENLKTKNENLQEQTFESKAETEELEVEIKKLKDISVELGKQKQELEQEKLNLLEKVSLLEQESENLKKKAANLTLHNENLEKQLSEMQKNIDTSAKLAEESSELEAKLNYYLKKNNELQRQNEELKLKFSALENHYSELRSGKEVITKKLEEVSVLSEMLKAESEEFRLQYQKSKTELDGTRDTLLRTTKEKENLIQSLTDVNEKNNELQKEVSKAENSLKMMKQQVIKKELEIKEVVDKLENESAMSVAKHEENRKLLETRVNKLIDQLEVATQRCDHIEELLEEKNKEVISLNVKCERLTQEKSDLEKKVEVEEIISSQNGERVKSLEETIQDYEITISGLKNVVDTNLERLETLKEELNEKKNSEDEAIKLIHALLKENNINANEQGQGDFKSIVCENFKSLLKTKNEAEKRISDIENQIKDLQNQNTTMCSSFKEFVENLQILVMEKREIDSIEAMKSCFDQILSEIHSVLQNKKQLHEELKSVTNDKVEISKQVDKLELERHEMLKIKSELDIELKKEKEKVENLQKELSNRIKTVKPEKENILASSTRSNKSSEAELKKENLILKRKLVLAENTKNNLEKVLKELREEKKKIMPSSPNGDVLNKKLLQDYIQVKEDFERTVKEKESQIEELSRENEDLKMKSVPIKTEDNKKLVQDLQKVKDAYDRLMDVKSKLELEVDTLRNIVEERNSEIANLSQIKEAYEKLLEENNKVMMEVDTLKYKRQRDTDEFQSLWQRKREENSKKIKEVQREYEIKLEKMKDKMLRLYREEVNKKVKSIKEGQNETANLNLIKTVDHLKSELFEADQKIQLLEMEKEMLKANRKIDEARSNIQLQTVSSFTSIMTNEERAVTLPRPSITTKEITISKRTSIGGLSNNIPNLQMEDEEDLFNEKYLTDLQEGRCIIPAGRDSTNRFSELAWRNSMVPPHLKSSYPAETQFISPSRFKDEDIKTGNVEFDDSLCKLLPGEKPRKKDFGTTSYKKPGPPTPSKNGGRLSLQGNEVHPMREHCEAKTPKRSTPSRIKALFTGRNNTNRDTVENQPNITPSRGKRLSIFRRPR